MEVSPVGNHLSNQRILRCRSSVLARAAFLIHFLSQIGCRFNHFLRLHGSHSYTPGYKPLHSALPATPTLSWGTVVVMDSTEERVGNLRAHDSGGKHEFQGTTGRECCLMAVCEATIPRWSHFIGNIHFITGGNNYSANNLTHPRATPGIPFKWVDVLWIEWKDRTAYCRGVGEVWVDAWKRASPKEVDIILG